MATVKPIEVYVKALSYHQGQQAERKALRKYLRRHLAQAYLAGELRALNQLLAWTLKRHHLKTRIAHGTDG